MTGHNQSLTAENNWSKPVNDWSNLLEEVPHWSKLNTKVNKFTSWWCIFKLSGGSYDNYQINCDEYYSFTPLVHIEWRCCFDLLLFDQSKTSHDWFSVNNWLMTGYNCKSVSDWLWLITGLESGPVTQWLNNQSGYHFCDQSGHGQVISHGLWGQMTWLDLTLQH